MSSHPVKAGFVLIIIRFWRLHRGAKWRWADQRRPLPVPVGKEENRRRFGLSVGPLARHWVSLSARNEASLQHTAGTVGNIQTPCLSNTGWQPMLQWECKNKVLFIFLCRSGRKKNIMHYFLTVFLMPGSVVDALILEAPYTSMTEAVTVNPLSSVRQRYIDSSPLGIQFLPHSDMFRIVFSNTKLYFFSYGSNTRQRVILFLLFTFPFFFLCLPHPALYVPSRISQLG